MRDQVLSLVQALDQDFLVRNHVLTLVQALDQEFLSTGSSFDFSTSFGPRIFKYAITF